MAGLVLLQPPLIWADPVVELGPENTTTASAVEDESRALWTFPFLITFGVHGGYDSNPNTTRNGSGSPFTDEQLTLAYDRLRGPLDLKTLAALGVVERFDGETDVNASLGSFTQLSCIAATHLGRDRKRGLYFGAEFCSQRWSDPARRELFCDGRRAFGCLSVVAAVLNCQHLFLLLVRYQDSSTAAFSDRQENTLGEEFRFDLLRDTVLVADYRFLVVNYVTNPLDSTTNFALAGVEHVFNRRLRGQFRGGVSFRSFDQGGSEVDPEFEGSLDYALGSALVNWLDRPIRGRAGHRAELCRSRLRFAPDCSFAMLSPPGSVPRSALIINTMTIKAESRAREACNRLGQVSRQMPTMF